MMFSAADLVDISTWGAVGVIIKKNGPEGGEIHFPLQNLSIKPEQGKAIIFPPGYFHPHQVLAPITKRYIVQTWITDAEMVINHRCEEE